MFPQIQIPTDNFYKFWSFTFLILFLAMLITPRYLEFNLKLDEIDLEHKISISDDKVENLKNNLAINSRLLKIRETLLEDKRIELDKITIEAEKLLSSDVVYDHQIDKIKKSKDEKINEIKESLKDYENQQRIYSEHVEKELLYLEEESKNRSDNKKLNLFKGLREEIVSFSPYAECILLFLTVLFMYLWYRDCRAAKKKLSDGEE